MANEQTYSEGAFKWITDERAAIEQVVQTLQGLGVTGITTTAVPPTILRDNRAWK